MSECHELCPSRMGYECICFEMRAQAWEEGWRVGNSDSAGLQPTVNPYRKGTDNG